MKNTQLALLAGLALLGSAAWAMPGPPNPGAINYLEGQASIAGRPLSLNAGRSAILPAGQTLTTQSGRVEMLLAPGIFLRVADRSAVEMVSAGLADNIVTLKQGQALVEVEAIRPENNIVVNEAGAAIRLLKPGLYGFDAEHATARVFEGKALVESGDRKVNLGNRHEVALSPMGKLKAHGFAKDAYQDDFYRWASLRASYVADANVDAASRYANQNYANQWDNSNSWAGTGWYWDPGYDSYTFIPADGFFYSPFGWAFYSPGFVWGAPYWGGAGWGHRHFGPGYRPHPFVARPGSSRGLGFNAGGRAGFRGAAGSFHGFAGGGFHGGGGGGGFHGGGHR